MNNISRTINLNQGWEFTRLSTPVYTSPSEKGQYWTASFPKREMIDRIPDSTVLDEVCTSQCSFDWYPAEVPGVIQYDLVREGFLENPFSSAKAAEHAWWVSESDWLYRLKFRLEPGQDLSAGYSRAQIIFAGIDTFSDIWLNGTYIGKTDNALRTHIFELPIESVNHGDNEIYIRMKAHGRMISHKISEASRMNLSGPPSGLLGKSLIRRYQRSFYTNSSLLNLGTGVLGIGLNGEVQLKLFAEAQISEISIKTGELSEKRAVISVDVGTDSTDETAMYSVSAKICAFSEEDTVPSHSEQQVHLNANRHAVMDLVVNNPRLWWPAGYGEQPLYTVSVQLKRNGELISEKSILYGLKTVKLITKQNDGKPCFFLKINETRINIRGYNLLPLDYLKVHGTRDDYDNLFTIIEESGANTLRLWGGGASENEYMYDCCDRLGILVWQDFFLHSNVYPDYDDEFVENFSLEAEGLMKKVRNHVSLTLLCGGNEQYEGWEEWGWKESMDRFYGERLVVDVLPELAERFCKDVPYIVNSPHGLPRAQSPVAGDMHNWGNYYNSTKNPQFVSETCWSIESYSRPETLKEVMGLDVDRYDRPGWLKHWNDITGLPIINRFPYSSYFDVTSLRAYLRSLNIEQAFADFHALSNLRLHSPSNEGILYWSLNKGGPLFQFGCVDYLGYPLMSYYVTKRLFAGVVIQSYRDIGDIRIVGSNETLQDIEGILRVSHMNIDGIIINQWEKQLIMKSGATSRILDLNDYYHAIDNRLYEIIHAALISGDSVITEDVLLFAPFSEVAPTNDPIEARVKKLNKRQWEINLSSQGVVKMVELECDRKSLFSDNYFAMVPHQTKCLKLTALDREPPEKLTVHGVDSVFLETIRL